MRRWFMWGVAAALVFAPVVSGLAAAAGDVSVTVTYTGKGKVDETHEIWVALFANPDMNERPVAVQPIRKSGGTAVFKDVALATVYVMFAYDERGDWDATAGPPPPGTPIGSYSRDGKAPTAVKPGPTAKIKSTFGDTKRMGQ